MKEDSMGFQRGQVWFKKVDTNQLVDLEENKSLSKKNRGYLIITDNEDIDNAYTINCVPVYTEHELTQLISTDVTFVNRGVKRYARCSQIFTFDKAVLNNYDLGNNYMYTLSEDIMKQVDLALVVRLSLYKSAYDLTTLYVIVNKIVKQKEIELQKKYTEVNISMIEKIADRVDDILKLNVDFGLENSSTKTTNLLTENNSINDIYLDTVDTKETKKQKKLSSNKSKALKEIDKLSDNEFLVDYQKWSKKEISLEDILMKYNVKNIKALYSKKYLIKKRNKI